MLPRPGDAPLIHQERLDRRAHAGERRGQRRHVQAPSADPGPTRASAGDAASGRPASTQPKRRASTKRSSSPPASRSATCVCGARARAGRLDAQPPGHAEVDRARRRLGRRRRRPTRMYLPIRRTPAIARPTATARRPRRSTLRRRCSGLPLHQTDSMRRPRSARRAGRARSSRPRAAPASVAVAYRAGRRVGKRVREPREVRDRQLLGALACPRCRSPRAPRSTASSPNAAASARRSILRRVANACLTTASNSAGVAHGRQRRRARDQAHHRRRHGGRRVKRPGRTWNRMRASACCATATVSRP